MKNATIENLNPIANLLNRVDLEPARQQIAREANELLEELRVLDLMNKAAKGAPEPMAEIVPAPAKKKIGRPKKVKLAV